MENNKQTARRSVQLSPTSMLEFSQRRKSLVDFDDKLVNEMLELHDEIERISGPRVQEDMKEISLNLLEVILMTE